MPFRNSTLTKLLQGALGGESVTMMLACLNPGRAQLAETQSVLKYATKATSVVNKQVEAKKVEPKHVNREADPMEGDVFDTDDYQTNEDRYITDDAVGDALAELNAELQAKIGRAHV